MFEGWADVGTAIEDATQALAADPTFHKVSSYKGSADIGLLSTGDSQYEYCQTDGCAQRFPCSR